MLRHLKNFILPTAANNYRAYLLSNLSLATLVILLIGANLFFGSVGIEKAYAQVSEQELVKLHNQERSKNGLGSLTYNSILSRSAKAKAEAMLKSDCWSHYCPDGKSPWDFFKDAGYTYLNAGENLAEGFSDNSAVMKAWMNSKTHRENILKEQFTEVGIGIAFGNYQGLRNNTIVVVHFGRPKNLTSVTASAIPTLSGVDRAAPSLAQPKTGDIFKQLPINVTGIHSGTDVLIEVNDKPSGRISPTGGLFTFEASAEIVEGANSIKAVNSEQTGLSSEAAVITLDRQAPRILAANLLAGSKLLDNANAVAGLQFDYMAEEELEEINLIADGKVYSGERKTAQLWQITMPLSTLPNQLEIVAIDFAGNQTQANVNPENYTRIADELTTASSISLTAGSAERSLGQNIEQRLREFTAIFKLNPLQTLSLLVILSLLLLFIADYYSLKHYNHHMITTRKSRAQLHIPTLAVLAVLLLIGNFKGNV